eukprot:scaffold42803_cov69-Phaeocystis_antarctica.AAC.1
MQPVPRWPTRRPADGSGALCRPRLTLRRPTRTAAPRAQARRCTQTTTRRPPAHPPRPAPSPPGHCAFGATSLRASPAASTNSPAIAAAVSPCPPIALTLLTTSGACASPRACSSAACSEPASIGSPSAVPVPCASSRATSAAATPASASAACSSARCAVPLGAVRLALLPPCRGPRRQLQHHCTARLAAHVAVRAVVKRVAPPSCRRHARHSESEVNMRREHEVDRLEQPVFALAQLHGSPRGVTCRKRCRAGRII